MNGVSWKIQEGSGRLALIHDNRWLAILGIPLAAFGLAVAVVPWLIDEARDSGAWPILAGGGLIGCGIFFMGMTLCFHYVEVLADRKTSLVTRRAGLPPFQRVKSWPLGEISEVECVNVQMVGGRAGGSSTHYQIQLVGPSVSIQLASSLDPEPIREEALRWARFLDKPFADRIKSSPEERLRNRLDSMQET